MLIYKRRMGKLMEQNSESGRKTIPQIKIKLIYCLIALTAFIGGVLIYVFFRDTGSLVIFKYFPKPSFLESLSATARPDTLLGHLFVFNLPHGLWCLSGLLVIRVIWLTNIKWRMIYAGIFLVVISALEISQLSAKRNGVFDVLDLASYGVFAFVESLAYNKFIRRRIL